MGALALQQYHACIAGFMSAHLHRGRWLTPYLVQCSRWTSFNSVCMVGAVQIDHTLCSCCTCHTQLLLDPGQLCYLWYPFIDACILSSLMLYTVCQSSHPTEQHVPAAECPTNPKPQQPQLSMYTKAGCVFACSTTPPHQPTTTEGPMQVHAVDHNAEVI